MLNACDVAAVHLQRLLDTKQLNKEERFTVELGVHGGGRRLRRLSSAGHGGGLMLPYSWR